MTNKKPGSAADPLWFKDAVIYELHVKAFADGNGDGIGDFSGLLGKLDYLSNLGVTCIWLLPFFPSPMRDDGYDISNYEDVNPAYGTLDDFKAFVSAAHLRGIQVMIELVINHTSDQHPWFQTARRSPVGSPERDIYVWSDTDKLFSGVRIIFTDTEKSNWTWDEEAKAYYWHRFFSHQPDLNFDNPRVLEEVLRVMRLWLDMGVDGLRLDAIPYLVERDQTSCENLPETHTVIRKIREAIDAEYTNRLILAEANMWPADVRPYFGNGDECHMAFHFPLMPRIYMALRQEDRLPVTEIMAQTPDIPDSCQWGLFLRNHDELTLEMVTNEERDYMYFAYSADPRMRINVGIRRRLAPLVDNNRRRIELLNSILFSFPGTPILYYGDEIGMGDNIYLGDRNGVRTPMQWNSDRNAGFSRAVPARLYSPVIMDPIWGYQAINVEAQEADTSSLLNWTRNMVALRKLFQVFGRGSLEFLNPENRKILAYVREYQTERVLCVANLSRFAQPVTLNLSRWKDMVPVEMLGYVNFPRITDESYVLTLGPYAFLWLELQEPAVVEAVSLSEPSPLDLPATNIAEVLEGPGLALLQERLLPRFLSRQRWFGSKTRSITKVLVTDWGPLEDTEGAIAILEVEYSDGPAENYVIVFAISPKSDEAEEASCIGNLAATSKPGGPQLRLIDGLTLAGVRSSILSMIYKSTIAPTRHGRIAGLAGSFLGEVTFPSESRISNAEQSNTSIFYDDRLILKLFRKVEAGINPDIELGRALTEVAGFTYTPRFAGCLTYARHVTDGDGSNEFALAVAQEQISSLGDGWSWTLSTLGKPLADNKHSYSDAARLLGKRTAEMHQALQSLTTDESRPVPATQELVDADAARLRNEISITLLLLRRKLVEIPETIVDKAALVLSKKASLNDVVSRFQAVEVGAAGRWARIHGDFHLGQLLRTEDDFVILDFEGEPAKGLSERRYRQSPLRDVAGMIRSFSYAQSFLERQEQNQLSNSNWAHDATNTYVESYLSSQNLTKTASFEAMLTAYTMEKALYELRYELNNRPDWACIPINGILDVLR